MFKRIEKVPFMIARAIRSQFMEGAFIARPYALQFSLQCTVLPAYRSMYWNPNAVT